MKENRIQERIKHLTEKMQDEALKTDICETITAAAKMVTRYRAKGMNKVADVLEHDILEYLDLHTKLLVNLTEDSL